MYEFENMEEILEKFKDILSVYHPNKKVKLCDIANVLRLKEANLYSRKKRNAVPFEEILLFCKRTGHNPIEIFFKVKKS